jgi:WD40 repeat protein
LLVGEDGLRIVGRDGPGRALGRWSGATWSPGARFVAAWRGSTLVALTPAGVPRWSIAAPAPVSAARWSPEGFHVAYLAGRSLRIVAGNGLRDRLWRAGVAPVTPEFRPGARRSLAWVRTDGRIPVVDVFDGVLRARSGPRLGRGARALAWSGDGRRLAVLARGTVRIWDVRRGTVHTVAVDGRAQTLAAAPRGGRFAVLAHDERRGVSSVVLLGADEDAGDAVRVRGRLRDLAFSPDGRRLLATWPAGHRWLLLATSGRALESAPTVRGRPGRVAGWCCDG